MFFAAPASCCSSGCVSRSSSLAARTHGLAVLDQMLADPEQTAVEVDICPAKAERLAPPQPAKCEEVEKADQTITVVDGEEGVEPVTGRIALGAVLAAFSAWSATGTDGAGPGSGSGSDMNGHLEWLL